MFRFQSCDNLIGQGPEYTIKLLVVIRFGGRRNALAPRSLQREVARSTPNEGRTTSRRLQVRSCEASIGAQASQGDGNSGAPKKNRWRPRKQFSGLAFWGEPGSSTSPITRASHGCAVIMSGLSVIREIKESTGLQEMGSNGCHPCSAS